MKRKAKQTNTDNLPDDFDLYDVGELSAKCALVLKLNALIASRGLSEDEAAALADMVRAAVTPEQRERLRNVTLDHLMVMLAAFGQHVEIVVRPVGEAGPAGITVSV